MKNILPFLIITLIIAALAAPLASSWPDGLNKVSEILGFSHRAATEPLVKAPMPDYNVPGLEDSSLSGSLAGLAGALLCFVIPLGLYLIRKK
jgi:hypothetical protein